MNRRSFFKKSVVIVSAAVVAPSVALKAVESLGKKSTYISNEVPQRKLWSLKNGHVKLESTEFLWRNIPSNIKMNKVEKSNHMELCKLIEQKINRYRQNILNSLSDTIWKI